MFLQPKLRFVLPADAGNHLSLLLLCSAALTAAHFSIPFLLLLSTMLSSSSFLFSLSIGTAFPHGFCWFLYAISFLVFSGFMLWPQPDLQTAMNFLLFEHLGALAHFIFWSSPLIHDVGFLPVYLVTLTIQGSFSPFLLIITSFCNHS